MIDPAGNPSRIKSDLAQQIGAKATSKLKAQRNRAPGVWFGLGLMGVIGWSVVVPTLLGAALGLWLDEHYTGGRSWTLALLVAGLTLGCLNAWHWVAKEDAAMREARMRAMNDPFILVPAWLAGGTLGAIFFGGLWWTVRKMIASTRPAPWVLVSLLLRMGLTSAGFYFVSDGDWQRLLACFIGFLMARLLVIWTTRLPPAVQLTTEKEVDHAS